MSGIDNYFEHVEEAQARLAKGVKGKERVIKPY